MKVSKLLERMATVMAEQGHFQRGRDVMGVDGAVCLYQAAGIACAIMYTNGYPLDGALWYVPAGHQMEHWLVQAGAPHYPGVELARTLMDWSDNTDDETVILTIKRAAELARAAGD